MTTKAELVDAVAEMAGVSKADAERTIGAFFNTVIAKTRTGGKVVWPGFGTFSTTKRPARTGRNPQTGEPVRLRASIALKFTPSAALRTALVTTGPGRSATTTNVGTGERAATVPSAGHDLSAIRERALAEAESAFREEIAPYLTEHLSVDTSKVVRETREAARRLVASMRWAQIVGDRIDTRELRELLGISRQALNQRTDAGTLIATPGNGTSWYPTWQFVVDSSAQQLEVRPVVAPLVQAFRDQLGEDHLPLTLLGWAATPQPELDGLPPSTWIREGRADDTVLECGRRAAAALGR